MADQDVQEPVARYDLAVYGDGTHEFYQSDIGDWVKSEAYAELAQENARLKAENDRLEKMVLRSGW
jgi:hypothetical protein